MDQELGRQTDPHRSVGHQVAKCRMAHGVSSALLWRDLGIAPRLLELYEAGAYPVAPDHLAALARLCGVDPAELGHLEPEPPRAAARPEFGV